VDQNKNLQDSNLEGIVVYLFVIEVVMTETRLSSVIQSMEEGFLGMSFHVH